MKLAELPADGWINGCCICYEPTSRVEKYQHDGIQYDVAICGKCNKFTSRTKINAMKLLLNT